MLLLTESKSVFNEGKVRAQIINNILQRYCSDYISSSTKKINVPRYLLNDLIRYWRTIAVDFGTKRWRTSTDDSHLRLAKLRATRKILFAGPLATLLLLPKRVKNKDKLIEYLTTNLNKPPILQLAGTVMDLNKKSQKALKNLLLNYNSFISILDDPDARKIFEEHKKWERDFKKLRDETNQIGNSIQESLAIIFFEDPLFKESFKKYIAF